MFGVRIYATPLSVTLLFLSLSVWLCICRWIFRYDMRDQEIVYWLVVYFIVITILNMIFLGHLQFIYDYPPGMRN